MKRPQPKDFGYEEPSPWDEGGWVIEGGEAAYEDALEKWQEQQPSTPDPIVDAASKDYPQLEGKTRVERLRFLINAVAEAAEKQGREFPVPPFYCLDEGDGKPRCQVQCPYCEKA